MMMITMSFCTFDIERDSPKKKKYEQYDDYSIESLQRSSPSNVSFKLIHIPMPSASHVGPRVASSRSDRRQVSCNGPRVQGSTGAYVMLDLCLMCNAATITPLGRG